MMTGFHGTTYQNTQNILRYGFDEDRFPTWTSDLGAGVYGYIDAPEMPFDSAAFLAKSYAQLKSSKHHDGNNRVAVVKFELAVASADVCDFNNISTILMS